MLCLPRPELVSVNLPFSGFYESRWSRLIDDEETSYMEHVLEEPDRYSSGIVHAAKEQVLYEVLMDNSRYEAAHIAIATDYAEAYTWWLAKSLGFPVTRTEETWVGSTGYVHKSVKLTHPCAWEFEELTSPRFYNFETGRVFAKIDAVVLRALLRRLLLVDNSWALDREVRNQFTSYDGFASFYDNDPEALKAKPLEEWDHNELGVLLGAWERIEYGPRSGTCAENELYEGIAESNQYWGNCVDWDKAEADAALLLLEWQQENGVEPEEAPYHCPDTLELPL